MGTIGTLIWCFGFAVWAICAFLYFIYQEPGEKDIKLIFYGMIGVLIEVVASSLKI